VPHPSFVYDERHYRTRAFANFRRRTSRLASHPRGQRSQVFLRFHDLLLERRDEALDVIQLESGKARRHAFEEVLAPG